jgi:hypothetical protein
MTCLETDAQITALGLVVLRSLTGRSEDVHWLTPKPRAWLEGRLRAREARLTCWWLTVEVVSCKVRHVGEHEDFRRLRQGRRNYA